MCPLWLISVSVASLLPIVVDSFFLDEDVYSNLKNLNGVLKVFLLKISVGLITLQGIIVECLIAFGGNPYNSNSQYSADDRLQRNFCKISTFS